jgi:hypothetical protein
MVFVLFHVGVRLLDHHIAEA